MKIKRMPVFLLVTIMLIVQLSFAFATDINTELVTNGGAEAGSISGWTDDTGMSRWNASTTYSTWAVPAAGSYYFYLYNPSMDYAMSGTMSQEITLTDANGLFSSISNGNVSINFSISMFQNISADNEAKAILEEYDASGTLLKTSQVVNTTTSGAMGSYQINTQVQPDTRKFKVLLSATLTKGGYAQFDKVSLKLVDASAKNAPVFGSNFPTSAETDAGVTYSAPFTISDVDAGDIDKLTFSASTTNVNLVPAANITVSGSGANRTLNIVPAGNLSGEADITVSASDGAKSAEKTFHLTVHKIISMNTNLVENCNATSEYASWYGSTVNVTATGDGFALISPGAGMYQNLDISKFSGLIDGGETKFNMSASFSATYGVVKAQFYTDIACTNPVGSVFTITSSTTSLEQYIPANAKGVQITMLYTSGVYSTVTIRNISFRIINDFPKISAVSDKTTNLSALTVPVNAYYTTASATLTASASDQTIVPNSGFTYGGSGFNRTVTFTPLKNGTVTITVTLNDGTTSTSKSFNVNALEPASVSSVDLPTAGYYASGSQMDFTVHFNHNITGGTGSTLPLTIGTTAVSASYLSSTANSITYRYTVTSSDAGAVAIGTTINDTSSPITDTAGYDAVMDISSGATSAKVVQAPQVTSSSASTTYGDKITFTATLNCAETLSGTIQFKANGTNLGSPITLSGNAASFETDEKPFDAGSVSITAEFIPDSSYHFTSLTSSVCTVAIQQKAVSISGFVAASKTYDGTTDVTLSGGTLVNVLAGDNLSAVYPSTGIAAEKNAGTRSVAFMAITLDGADKANYVLSAQPTVSVEILKKAVTATVAVSNKNYDGNTNAAVACGFDSGVLFAGDVVTVTASGTFDTKDVGTGKAVSISGVSITGTDKDNYDITIPTSGSADINPLAITVTPEAVTKTYGQDDPALTYKITSGALVASETLTGSLKRAAGEDVGNYEITQDTLTNASNPNYYITFTSDVKLTIIQATPVVTVSVDKASQMTGKDVAVTVKVTYPNKKDADTYPATVSITPINASAKGSISVSENQYTQAFTMGSDLTSASFSASVAANGNYSGASSTSPATVAIIDRYTPTISVTSHKGSSVTYGDTVTFTATVSDPNGAPEGKVQFYVDGAPCGEVTLASGTASLSLAADPLTAGNRSVTAIYTPAANETDYKTNTSSAFSLIVNPKPVSITGLSAVAREYSGEVNVELTGGTISGMLDGAALTANIPTTGTIPDKNAGTRPVTFTTIVLSGADKDNYVLCAQPSVSVEISKKAVTATVTVSNKDYDGNTNAVVTCSFKSGVLSVDNLTVSASGTFDTKDTGTGKTVTISGAAKDGTDKDNYSVTVPSSGTANITPLAITVTPDAITKTYGQSDPALTYKITSGTLVASETLTGSLKRAAGEDVGNYEITQDTLTNASNPNYYITFTSDVKLIITQAMPVVAVTANKASPAYGDTVTFTATVSKAGSGAVPMGTVQFWLGSKKIGSPITLTSGSASYTTTQTDRINLLPGDISVTAEYIPDTDEKNYIANTNAYSITIAKREVTVKADDKTIYVGAKIPDTLTYIVTGLIGSDALVTLPTLSLPTGANTSKADGYTISITGATVSECYTVKMVTGTLHVINIPASSDTPTSTAVEVNGEKQDAGTSDTQTVDNKTVTTIKVDDTKLDKILESSGEKPTVTLPASGNSDVVVGELNGQTVKNMEAKEATLEIKTGTVTYTLPASQINIDDVSSQIGSQVELKDIKVSVKIADPPADTVKVVEDTASKGNYQIVVKPVEFTITCTSGDKTIEVSKFNGYVERTVAIPDGIDPSKITTGIVLNSDGSFSHVPTSIVVINGKYFAKINSLTNSTYSVIWNPITFTDVSSHWAKNAINDMGSRMVVTGIGNGTYEPDRSITRAEFAAIVVRAMGLQKGTTESAFGDVSASDWFNGYVDTATSYALITGYDSGSYGPTDTITREQAMAILARAMKLTGLSVSLTDTETSALLAKFTDGSKVSEYAKTSAAMCLKTGVVTGSSATTISPKDYVTRAEVAVMVQRLLQKSGLI